MAIGDVFEAEDCTDVYYVDTGMYDTPAFGSVYVVDAERPAVVDTGLGTNVDRVEAALDAVGVDDLGAIVLTHVHLDHAGGAGFLAESHPDADVYIHEVGAPHLADPGALVEGTKRAVGSQWEFYVEPEPVPEERIVELAGGDTIDLGDRALDVHHAPGHAPHQVVFQHSPDGAVFCADAAGIWVPDPGFLTPTSPPPNFDFEQALADLDTLRDLDPTALLYGHFGPRSDADAALDEYETVLEDWVADVDAARAELGDDDAVVERFQERTDLDDVWPESKAYPETRMNVEGVLLYLKRRDE